MTKFLRRSGAALLAACTPDAVDATIDPANLASWRILEKLGLRSNGEMTLYAIRHQLME